MREAATSPDADLTRQREVIDAFLAAARGGDFEALVAVLDPYVVLRSDGGVVRAGLSRVVRGATAVAEHSLTFSQFARSARTRPALVNGAAGVVSWSPEGQLFSVMGCTIRHGEIDILADSERLSQLDLALLED